MNHQSKVKKNMLVEQFEAVDTVLAEVDSRRKDSDIGGLTCVYMFNKFDVFEDKLEKGVELPEPYLSCKEEEDDEFSTIVEYWRQNHLEGPEPPDGSIFTCCSTDPDTVEKVYNSIFRTTMQNRLKAVGFLN